MYVATMSVSYWACQPPPSNYAIGPLYYKTKCYIITKSKGILFTVSNKTLHQYIENDWGHQAAAFGATAITTSLTI